MISDSLENINKYHEIPDCVKEFVKNLTPDLPCGRYEIDENTFANVDEYEPKLDPLFESHKNYIDIQILLKGIEALEFTKTENLNVKIPYDKQKDVMFYDNETIFVNKVILGNGNFVMLYPYEAHKPQIKLVDGKVKKVVVKLSDPSFHQI